MRRFLNRLAWRNLPIAAKTALLFALQLASVLALMLVIRAAFVALRVQLETGGSASIEMRSLANDLQIGVERLQRLESRLVEQRVGWSSFDRIEASLRRDHAQITEQLQSDAARLAEQAEVILGTEEMVPINVEVRTIQTNARTSEDDFNQIMNLVVALTWPQEGALTFLQRYGDDLQQLTIQQGNADLINQMLLMRNLEHTLVETGERANLQALHDAANVYLEIYQAIPLTEKVAEIPEQLELYLDQVDEVARLLDDLQAAYRSAQLAIEFSRGAASRLGTISEAQRQVQIERLNAVQENVNRVTLVALVLAMAFGMLLTFFFARDMARRTRGLLAVARQLEAGNLSARAPVHGEDEAAQIARSFNAMAAQLEELVGGLEKRVAERTRDLSITAEIGRAVTEQRNPRDLMNEIVELIRQRFGFYHAQVFLVDEEGHNANLAASTGRAGLELLARRHFLPVGSQSVIGQVTALGEPVVASDTDTDPIHRRNELLPDTRSEMALPMRVGERVIGALDVQSVAPNAFDEDTVAVFQIIADQLAIALENARLYAQTTALRTELEALQRRMMAEDWEAYREGRGLSGPLAYALRGSAVEPHREGASPSVAEAMRTGRIVALDSGDGEVSLGVPIRVRGEVIGAFGFSGEHLRDLTEDDLVLVEAIVDRVGLALENLRLMEETARRAEHEQLLNEITAKIVGSTDVNQILQTTVRELGRVLRAPQTSVRLRREGVE